MEITQDKIDQILANPEIESKIKLRRLSHANLLEHVKNIPYKVGAAPMIKSSKIHLPEDQKQLHVSPKKYIQLVTGKDRPINVKEDKMKNIERKSSALISEAIQLGKDQLGMETNTSTQTPSIEAEHQDQQTVIPSTNNEVVSDEIKEESVPTVSSLMAEQNSPIRQSESSDLSNGSNEINSDKNNSIIDINTYMAKIDQETQLVKSVKNEATLAQEQALVSDENLSKISVEVSELEKQEEEVKRRNSELDRQLVAAYENQTKTLMLVRKEYEGVIEEANNRRQANENKILQFQSRINDIRENITGVNESIAKKQEILAALQQTEFMSNDNTTSFDDSLEEKVKRIA